MPGLRLAMPLVVRRGAGLGNELMPWAMAFIASQALNLELLHPAWGANPRAYWRYFGTSRLDWPAYFAMRHVMPVYPFQESDYRSAGRKDLYVAAQEFGVRNSLDRKRFFIMTFAGMWCGFAPLVSARPFLLGELLSTRGTAANLLEVERRLDGGRPRIGMHVRRGDFGGPPTEFSGRFNAAIPIEWYVSVAQALNRLLQGRATFVIVSDASPHELTALTDSFDCITTHHQQNRDVSDLLILAGCDFLVCSISSFSLWAAFFSDSRYAWFAPQLTWMGGLGSIWGHQAEQQRDGSETVRSAAELRKSLALGVIPDGRGIAVDWDAHVPDQVVSDIERRVALRRREFDLVAFGSVVAPGFAPETPPVGSRMSS